MRERWGFAAVHVYIRAGADLRSKRYADRSGGSNSSFRRASAHAVERNVPDLERLADYTIANTSLVEELEIELRGLVERWCVCR